jgi:hypothetical protein
LTWRAGHCWSDESLHEALPHTYHIRPSNNPKCTHAYVLSPEGAQHLLKLLKLPIFAYSRALDQALAHLVQSGRMKAYSYTPSLVIQTKETGSDVWGATSTSTEDQFGSNWREFLADSALQRIRKLDELRQHSRQTLCVFSTRIECSHRQDSRSVSSPPQISQA